MNTFTLRVSLCVLLVSLAVTGCGFGIRSFADEATNEIDFIP